MNGLPRTNNGSEGVNAAINRHFALRTPSFSLWVQKAQVNCTLTSSLISKEFCRGYDMLARQALLWQQPIRPRTHKKYAVINEKLKRSVGRYLLREDMYANENVDMYITYCKHISHLTGNK